MYWLSDMSSKRAFDLLIIGGGLAGSALGRAMALAGASVLIIEKERAFRDRIRGEVLHPWGTVEAEKLGLYALLLGSCAREVLYEAHYLAGRAAPPRDYRATTPQGTCGMAFYHPDMQEVLLAAATGAGAEVWRGSHVQSIEPGSPPRAVVLRESEPFTVEAHLIVAADGRESRVANLIGFRRQRDPELLLTGGLQLKGKTATTPDLHFFLGDADGLGSILVSTRPGNYRAYLLHHREALPRRLSGKRDYPEALKCFRRIGIPADWLSELEPHGLFATFDGAHRWIDTPCRDNVALIGDAAGASDPVWGNGLSRTLRDVRLLRDHLVDDRNWGAAARAYAADHDDFFQRLRKIEHLHAELIFSMGPEAARRRDRASELMERDPELNPDMTGRGPEARYSPALVSTLLQR